MDYKKMWDELSQYVEMAVEEGTCLGYDKEKDTFNNGAFCAYDRIREMMDRMEGEQNESN